VAGSDDDLLDELRALVERFPLPHPLWHRYVGEMHEMIVDLTAALDALATLSRARDELRRHVDGDADPPPEHAGGPTVAAARARLRALPVPQGEHPYLDEILLTLEAAEAALAALASSDGDRALAEAIRRLAGQP
jgi:hypothetical protein